MAGDPPLAPPRGGSARSPLRARRRAAGSARGAAGLAGRAGGEQAAGLDRQAGAARAADRAARLDGGGGARGPGGRRGPRAGTAHAPAADDPGHRRRLTRCGRRGLRGGLGGPRPARHDTIPTSSRPRLLVERSLASELAQTHERLEVLVIGDAAGPEIAAAVESAGDPRVRFANVGHQFVRDDASEHWLTAATLTRNEAYRSARGRWLLDMDDDDALRPGRRRPARACARRAAGGRLRRARGARARRRERARSAASRRALGHSGGRAPSYTSACGSSSASTSPPTSACRATASGSIGCSPRACASAIWSRSPATSSRRDSGVRAAGRPTIVRPCRRTARCPDPRTSPRWSRRCSSAGASATSSASRCAAARAPSRGSSTRARRPPTAGPAPTTSSRACSRTSTRATRRCAATTSSARAAGTATACRSRSRSSSSSASRPRHEIERYGIAEFNQRCRESVFEFLEDWNALTERIGFWIDLDDAYRTLDADLHRVGLVGAAPDLGQGPALRGPQGRALLPALRHRAVLATRSRWATRTSIDPSVYVRFPVVEDGGPLQAGDELLVWTTTPWTLVSNAAVAVDPELTYVRATRPDERLRARRGAGRARARRGRARSLDRFPGAALDGVRYEPPFPFIAGRGLRRARPHRPARRLRHRRRRHRPRAHRDRLRRGRLPPRRAVRPERRQPGAARRHLRRAHRPVRRALRQGRRPRPRSRTCARAAGCCAPSDYEHAYPHCWRCGTPLLYYAKPSWYIAHLEAARPAAGRQRDGRLAPRAHQARALRQLAGEQRRLGAVARALLGHAAAGLALRGRPRRTCDRLVRRARGAARACASRTRTGRTSTTSASRARSAASAMRRVPEVIDVWFDSGAMPFAQYHAPFENEERFERALPGRLHLRGARPDARLVLLAARRSRRCCSTARPTRTSSASG